MAQQPFTIGILKQITDQYDAGEISYGKLVELLNDVALKWHNSTISKTETVKTMAQQTAVEWLEEKFNKWAEGRQFMLHDYFEIAKNKEKQQIMNAYIDGELQQGFEAEAELYYNQQYGKGDNL